MTMLRLGIEPAELGMEDSTLPLTEPVVGSVDIVTVEPFTRHAAAIVHRACQSLHLVIVGNDDSTLAGRHQLARLEAERSCASKSPDAASAPLRAVCVRTVFNEGQMVSRCNFTETIQIGGMPAHVHRNDCLGARRNCGFRQTRVNAVCLCTHIHHHGHCAYK